MFTIRMGIPEMEEFWEELETKADTGIATKDEIKLYKKIGKALVLLAKDPRAKSMGIVPGEQDSCSRQDIVDLRPGSG